MASQESDRGVAVAMGVAVLAGIVLSLVTSNTGDWRFFTWLFLAFSLFLAAMSFYYAAVGRSVIGQLPSDPSALRRLRNLAVLVLIAVAVVLFIQLGSAITGSWESTDGMFIGLYVGLGILFVGRLLKIRRIESAPQSA